MVEAPKKEFEFIFAAGEGEETLQQSQKDSFANTYKEKINADDQLYTVLSNVAQGSPEADELAARLENLSLEEQAKVESEQPQQQTNKLSLTAFTSETLLSHLLAFTASLCQPEEEAKDAS